MSACPLKQTFVSALSMSALCHEETSPHTQPRRYGSRRNGALKRTRVLQGLPRHLYIHPRILGALGRKEEARENWQKILAEDPSWTAESFVKWYKTWNMRDGDIAKLMEGIYKTGVLGAEAKPGQ